MCAGGRADELELRKVLKDKLEGLSQSAFAGVALGPAAGDGRLQGEAARNRLEVLAHELRTPLAGIVTLAEIMRDERLGPIGGAPYVDYAGSIFDTARHALEVLDSAIERGAAGSEDAFLSSGQSSGIEMVDLDIAAFAAQTIQALLPLAEAWGVRLTFVDKERSPCVIANRRTLRQIILNLVMNAVRFTPPGGEIRVAVQYAAGGPLHLEVRDSGDGLDAREAAEINALIIGERPHWKRSRSGTGIGLPLVAALAKVNGAALTMDRNEGKGTIARITFVAGRVVPV